MKHEQAAWTSSVDMQQGDMDLEQGHTKAWTYSMEAWNLAWTNSRNNQHVHAAWTYSVVMQHRHTARTCSMEAQIWRIDIDLQHGHWHAIRRWTCSRLIHATQAWTCSMDMDMQHGYGHTVWTWAFSMDIDRHSAWTLTCTMDMYIQHEHGQAGHSSNRKMFMYCTLKS
jgi:hypothetical protein